MFVFFAGYAIFGVAIGISSTAWILYHFERNYKRYYSEVVQYNNVSFFRLFFPHSL